MIPLTTTFDVPLRILEGLANGTLIRRGGVIQDLSGRVVMWLREAGVAGVVSTGGLPIIDPITGALNLAIPGINSEISLQGFAAVGKQLNQIQGMVNIATAGSILTIGISAIGFTVIAKRLKKLEERLQKNQEALVKIDQKIDLSFYANFRTALDLATNAFIMTEGENRRSSALSAINRFLEAQNIYLDYLDQELNKKSQAINEYLLTLCLAYISEARCYLQLGETETAIRRLKEGKNKIHSRISKYIDILLTNEPLYYLHPELSEQTDLSRLTRIYQWKDPQASESSVFNSLRKTVAIYGGMSDFHIDRWIESLPPAIIPPHEIKKGFLGIKEEGRNEIINRLPQIMSEMESMIETFSRFEAYEIEAKSIGKLGIRFYDWFKYKPSQITQRNKNLFFIIPEDPIEI